MSMKDYNMDTEAWNKAVYALDAKDYASARTLFASIEGNKEAQLQLGYLYQEGLGGEINLAKAQEIFQALADLNDLQGTYFLAKIFLSSNQLVEATNYFEKSAELGHVSGAYWAAALHGGMSGYATDIHKRRSFLELAARLGHIYAKRDLALDDAKTASSLLQRGRAYLRYLVVLIEGLNLTFRNRHDFRIR